MYFKKYGWRSLHTKSKTGMIKQGTQTIFEFELTRKQI